MEQLGLFYARFMDDIAVLAPTRWKLKKAIGVLNQVLEALKLNKHPAKTFIGRVAKGFDFLGYHIEPERLKVSLSTLQNFAERISRLYEHGADLNRIGLYVRRWYRVTDQCLYLRLAAVEGLAALPRAHLRDGGGLTYGV